MSRSGTTGLIRFFAIDERGATGIEYALIAAGIGATIAVTVISFGNTLTGLFLATLTALS